MKTVFVSAEDAAYHICKRFGQCPVYQKGLWISMAWFGKYGPQLTLLIPADWPINERGDPRIPAKLYPSDNILPEFGFPFYESESGNGKNVSDVLFVRNYRLSTNCRPVVELASPDSFDMFLLRVHWGGDGKSTGRPDLVCDYEKHGIRHFAHTKSKSELSGYDWYLIPKDWRLTESGRSNVADFCRGISDDIADNIAEVEERYDRLWNPNSKSILDFIAANHDRMENLQKRLRGIAQKYVTIHGTCIEISGKYMPFTDDSLTKVEIFIRKNELFREHLGDFNLSDFATKNDYEAAVHAVVRRCISEEYDKSQLAAVYGEIPDDTVDTYKSRPKAEVKQLGSDATGTVTACPLDDDPDDASSVYTYQLGELSYPVELRFSGPDANITEQALFTILADRMRGNKRNAALYHIEAAANLAK